MAGSEPVAVRNNIFTFKMEPNNKTSIEDILNSGDSNIDNSLCEKVLQKFYNISENSPLLLKKIEFNSSTNLTRVNNTNASNGVNFAFFHPINFTALDMKLCSNLKSSISTPFKAGNRKSLDLYKSIPDAYGLDLYDVKSPAYQSRCFKGNNSNGADVSINFKRTQWFQNTTADCSTGCEYMGLDEYNYTVCDCQGLEEDSEISNDFSGTNLNDIGKFNYDIILCYKEVLTEVI